MGVPCCRWFLLFALPALLAQPAPEPPFEQTALEQVRAWLKTSTEPGILSKAEDFLTQSLRRHYAERERPLTGTNPWAEWETRLLDALRDVRRRRLDML